MKLRKHIIIGSTITALVCAFFYFQSNYKQSHELEEIHTPNGQPTEFIPSAQELKETSKWQNKSMDDMGSDAISGDPAALYMLGLCMLTGNGGWTIDTETANILFARSASLGFAPAINQMRLMYQEAQNPFLTMVYVNLTISLGHQELRPGYDQLRKQLVDDAGGLKIIREIEKIAAHKASHIINNKRKVHTSSNPGTTILMEVNNLEDEDVLFDSQFWQNIFAGAIETGNLNEWLESAEVYHLQLERNAKKAKRDSERISSYESPDED
jgi:hypothetical protein